MSLRIGHGYDIHRTAAGRKMVLGGVVFECDVGLDGHSDADCLTDIGNFFPDTDATWAGVDSQVLLRRVVQVLRENGWVPVNVDATLIAEKPRIARRVPEMKAALAASTGLPSGAIGIKATTNEGVGDLGRGLAVAAHAVALIQRA
jgi:2-C-methyl-D-erythritol 2,4-cyclodiphosphate synthase